MREKACACERYDYRETLRANSGASPSPCSWGCCFSSSTAWWTPSSWVRPLGVDALAAVGFHLGHQLHDQRPSSSGVCTGFAHSGRPAVRGPGDYADMRRFVANAGWLCVLFATVMTAVVSLLTRNILVFMRTPENIIDGAYHYILFIFLGIPATFPLQPAGRDYPLPGRLPDARVLSDPLQPLKYRAGSALHRRAAHGRGRSRLRHRNLPGHLGNPVLLLYAQTF